MSSVPYKPINDNATANATGDRQTMHKTVDQLERELELLAYVTSHNLQSPVRAILGYCDEINRQPGIKSKTISRENADALTYEAKRLKEMLQLMMEYIQLETHPVKHAEVNCNEVVHTAVTMHGHEIEAAGIELRIDELPVVWGHYGRITRLFGYLLDNAIKFNRKSGGRIEIKARPVENFWEFSIRDNGIGVNEDYTELAFRLFKRLHTAEEYPGYGGGLALSRKIVEAHGGTIRMESEVGKGTTVIFTLPKVQS